MAMVPAILVMFWVINGVWFSTQLIPKIDQLLSPYMFQENNKDESLIICRKFLERLNISLIVLGSLSFFLALLVFIFVVDIGIRENLMQCILSS